MTMNLIYILSVQSLITTYIKQSNLQIKLCLRQNLNCKWTLSWDLLLLRSWTDFVLRGSFGQKAFNWILELYRGEQPLFIRIPNFYKSAHLMRWQQSKLCQVCYRSQLEDMFFDVCIERQTTQTWFLAMKWHGFCNNPWLWSFVSSTAVSSFNNNLQKMFSCKPSCSLELYHIHYSFCLLKIKNDHISFIFLSYWKPKNKDYWNNERIKFNCVRKWFLKKKSQFTLQNLRYRVNHTRPYFVDIIYFQRGNDSFINLCHSSYYHFEPLTKVPHFGVTIFSGSNDFRHARVGNR